MKIFLLFLILCNSLSLAMETKETKEFYENLNKDIDENCQHSTLLAVTNSRRFRLKTDFLKYYWNDYTPTINASTVVSMKEAALLHAIKLKIEGHPNFADCTKLKPLQEDFNNAQKNAEYVRNLALVYGSIP